MNILEHIFSSLNIKKNPIEIEKFDISKVRDLLQSSLQNDINIKDITQQLDISERQLHHAFKLAYGFTPKQYLQNLRLNAIRNEFLLHRKAKVSEIAMKYHFLHMGHFSSEFKKMFGQTPSEVLKSPKV
jgi:AraC-like DNA-binding protein